jgi:hypothetical protein
VGERFDVLSESCKILGMNGDSQKDQTDKAFHAVMYKKNRDEEREDWRVRDRSEGNSYSVVTSLDIKTIATKSNPKVRTA